VHRPAAMVKRGDRPVLAIRPIGAITCQSGPQSRVARSAVDGSEGCERLDGDLGRLNVEAPGRTAIPVRERSVGVKAADRGRPVRGTALGRQPAVRLLVLRRSCRSGHGEYFASALRAPAKRCPSPRLSGCVPLFGSYACPRGALGAPLSTPDMGDRLGVKVPWRKRWC
jgi:hypothetical protein